MNMNNDEVDDKGGGTHPQRKVNIQYCPVEGCKYVTKSRNLGVHMKRWHGEEKTSLQSTMTSDGKAGIQNEKRSTNDFKRNVRARTPSSIEDGQITKKFHKDKVDNFCLPKTNAKDF